MGCLIPSFPTHSPEVHEGHLFTHLVSKDPSAEDPQSLTHSEQPPHPRIHRLNLTHPEPKTFSWTNEPPQNLDAYLQKGTLPLPTPDSPPKKKAIIKPLAFQQPYRKPEFLHVRAPKKRPLSLKPQSLINQNKWTPRKGPQDRATKPSFGV